MEEEYYKGYKLLLLNIALGLGTFIQVLDTSIANVAVPYIAGNLSVSAEEGTWVITSFAASNAVVLPLTGWLSAYFGRVRLFVTSILLFALASFLCGFSTSLSMLVFFRVIQGIVAGSLIPLSQSLLMANNPPDKQGAALGFWGVIVIVAPILGPILGGYLTEEYSWPWIFYINLPIGLFSAFIVWHFLKGKESKIVRDPIDWVGLALLAFGVATLQIMLDKGKDLDWFESSTIIMLTIVSAISLVYFAIWTYFQKFPIVDFSFFRDRNFAVGTLVITIGYLLFFGSTVTIPLWLQTEQRYTAYWAGVAVAPIGLVPMFLAITVGKNLHRVDLRFLASLSFFLFSLGYFYQSNFTTDVSIQTVMFTRFLQGWGLLIFFLPLVQISLGNIPKERYASASGIFNFVRILVGSGFGTSIAIQLWSHFAISHRAYLTETVTLYSANYTYFSGLLDPLRNYLSEAMVLQLLERQMERQAYMLSTNDLSWFAAWVFLLMTPLPLLCKKIKMQSGPIAQFD